MSDVLNHGLSVERFPHHIVCLDKLLKLTAQLAVLLVQKSHVSIERFNFLAESVLVTHLGSVLVFHVVNLIGQCVYLLFSCLEMQLRLLVHTL